VPLLHINTGHYLHYNLRKPHLTCERDWERAEWRWRLTGSDVAALFNWLAVDCPQLVLPYSNLG